jgi:hypothetical protein
MKRVWKVTRVACWDGWCSPCEREDRPLVLTRSGLTGVLPWLSGLGDDDRTLLLTCRVCGQWQVVPRREEDDPEVVLAEEVERVLVRARAVDALVELLRRDPVPAAPAPLAPAPLASAPPHDAAATAERTHERGGVTVPRPRPVHRLALLPDDPPAVSPEERMAAARVLAAARAGASPDAPVGAASIALPGATRAQVVLAVAI